MRKHVEHHEPPTLMPAPPPEPAPETLDSSKRIEVLLGGGEEVSVPTMMKVVYKHVLSQKK